MRLVSLSLFVSLVLAWAQAPSADGARVLLREPAYLGVAGSPEWDAFAGRTPVGASLTLDFEARANTTEQALRIRQADVKQDWVVDLNGQRLGTLARMEADLVHVLAVPAGAIRDGANTLRIAAKLRDDVVIREIALHDGPVTSLLSQGQLRVRVVGHDGAPLPARVTIVDADGALAALQAMPGTRQAVRPGVAYTGGDPIHVGLLPGAYRVRATRGPEYGMAETRITVRAGETPSLTLRLAREVPTKGWAAADTHIHTLERSGHGDASLLERMLTLAGEGIEVAVATEHNREDDYAPALAAAGVAPFVTPIVGNEVTTARGHFNVFPAATGAIAVLNHPHDLHGTFTPFARATFNGVTGASRGLERAFNAMEVVNSGAMRSDWMEPIRSWFALLDRGQRITPIGASDSHDVSRFIVGQGRTYVRVDDHDPGHIPVDEAVASLRRGRVVVSLGLFPELRIGSAGPGDVVPGRDARDVRARVLGASWISADRVTLFVNGREFRTERVATARIRGVEKAAVRWALPPRRHDYHVVLIASGPGVTDPSWAIPRPYQPTTTAWTPVVFGVTAPVLVDADGDGVFTSARGYAERLVAAHAELPALLGALADHDPVVAAHAAELLEARGTALEGDTVRAALTTAAPEVRDGFAQYLSAK